MSAIPEQLRRDVALRAGHRCEYCRLPQRGQVAAFPADHVLPRTAAGQTEAGNLALACAHCNAYKWAHVDGVDPLSGAVVPLFNPRTSSWTEHFRWSERDPAILEGLTATGRGTIDWLRMNDEALVVTRQLLRELGAFPP